MLLFKRGFINQRPLGIVIKIKRNHLCHLRVIKYTKEAAHWFKKKVSIRIKLGSVRRVKFRLIAVSEKENRNNGEWKNVKEILHQTPVVHTCKS
jgi:hypothetical protein